MPDQIVLDNGNRILIDESPDSIISVSPTSLPRVTIGGDGTRLSVASGNQMAPSGDQKSFFATQGNQINVTEQQVTAGLSQQIVAVSPQSGNNIVEVGELLPPPIEFITYQLAEGELPVIDKSERKEVVKDFPNPGDITIYHGIADAQSSDNAAVWLIWRETLTKDGSLFDTRKEYASKLYDQVWADYLSLTYL